MPVATVCLVETLEREKREARKKASLYAVIIIIIMSCFARSLSQLVVRNSSSYGG